MCIHVYAMCPCSDAKHCPECRPILDHLDKCPETCVLLDTTETDTTVDWCVQILQRKKHVFVQNCLDIRKDQLTRLYQCSREMGVVVYFPHYLQHHSAMRLLEPLEQSPGPRSTGQVDAPYVLEGRFYFTTLQSVSKSYPLKSSCVYSSCIEFILCSLWLVPLPVHSIHTKITREGMRVILQTDDPGVATMCTVVLDAPKTMQRILYRTQDADRDLHLCALGYHENAFTRNIYYHLAIADFQGWIKKLEKHPNMYHDLYSVYIQKWQQAFSLGEHMVESLKKSRVHIIE